MPMDNLDVEQIRTQHVVDAVVGVLETMVAANHAVGDTGTGVTPAPENGYYAIGDDGRDVFTTYWVAGDLVASAPNAD
jgi:hypothetical protein